MNYSGKNIYPFIILNLIFNLFFKLAFIIFNYFQIIFSKPIHIDRPQLKVNYSRLFSPYSKKYLIPIPASIPSPADEVICNTGTNSINISIGVEWGNQAIPNTPRIPNEPP